jgi:hypothetical protein
MLRRYETSMKQEAELTQQSSPPPSLRRDSATLRRNEAEHNQARRQARPRLHHLSATTTFRMKSTTPRRKMRRGCVAENQAKGRFLRKSGSFIARERTRVNQWPRQAATNQHQPLSHPAHPQAGEVEGKKREEMKTDAPHHVHHRIT